MKVGFLQFKPVFGDKVVNLKKVRSLLDSISADIVVLPELFNTGYLFTEKKELAELAEEIPGETTQFLMGISREKDIHIVAGIPERAKNKFFNSTLLIYPSGRYKIYRKIHLFCEEKFFFNIGDIPFKVYRIGRVKIGMLICFDWIFPEAARSLALSGAQIICHPSNLVLPYCQSAMVTRAIENRIFIITVNRIGREKRGGKELKFTGMSQIVAPSGKVLYRAGKSEEIVKIVEIRPEDADNKKITDYNDVIKDRRPNFYRKIVQ